METPVLNTARSHALRACMLGLALLAAAACRDKSAAARAAADSDLARDLALAGSQPAAQPSFQDTTVAPAPTPAKQVEKQPPAPVRTRTAKEPKRETPRPVVQTPAPQPAPAPVVVAPAPVEAPAPAPASIGAGSGLALTSGSNVCTRQNLPAGKLGATVSEAATGSGGAVIPAGLLLVLA